jgi:hypothetical protein
MDMTKLAEDFVIAVSTPDWDALEQMCAEDVSGEWLDVVTRHGRDSFMSLYRLDHKVSAGWRAELTEVLMHDAASVCMRLRVSVDGAGPMVTLSREYPATGKPWAIDALVWVHTTNGLITRVITAFNYLAVWTQGGYIDTP